MEPTSLSATALHVFELCPARFKAEFIDRVPRLTQSSGNLGTAVHETLEQFVADGHYKINDMKREHDTLRIIWTSVYYKHFSDSEKFDEGWEMIQKWHTRNFESWGKKTVLSTEIKEEYMLTVKVTNDLTVEVPFRWIWDRSDQLGEDEYEVVDYKTNILPVSFEEMKRKMQVRLYGLMAAIKFKDARKIWITLDMLRYDVPVGVTFSRDENAETWNYLKNAVIRILETDDADPPEVLNPECRFCVRASSCTALKKHAAGGGVLSFTTKEEAANRRLILHSAMKALITQLDQIDEYLRQACEDEEIRGFDTEQTRMSLKGRSYRTFDYERGKSVVRPDIFVQFAKMGVTEFDKMIKSGLLTADEETALRTLVSKSFGRLTVNTEPLTPWDTVEES